MSLTQITFIFFTAFLISLVSTPLIRNWARERQLVDKPDERKVHSKDIPRLGGVAILIGFLVPLFLFANISAPFRGLILGSIVVFATGLLDDLVHLSSRQKFLGQILACMAAIFIGKFYLIDLGNLFGFGAIELPIWLALPFTLFAIVGVSNALNLIDGLDGLAGGISSIALIAFLMLAVQANNIFVITVSAALLGSIIGFLKHNLYPARIFMGDGGSLFSGFVLAILAISLTQQGAQPVSPVLPLLVLGVPILDTLWVMASRIRHRLNPFIADRTHLHHKFLDLGFQHRFTVVIIYSISWIWAALVVSFPHLPDYVFLYAYLLVTLFLYLGLRYMLRHRNVFSWLSRDSMAGIRESVTFQNLVGISSNLIPVITLLLAIYPLTAILVQGACCNQLWPLSITLLCALALAHLPILKGHKGIQLIFTYLAILIIIYIVRVDGAFIEYLDGNPAYRLADIVLLAGLFLTALYVFINNQWEHFMTSMDSLLMGATLMLAIFFLHQTGFNHLPGVLLRGMAYYQGLKVLQLTEQRSSAVVLAAIVLALIAIAAHPLLNF